MSSNQPISKTLFVKRLTAFCMRNGQPGFPKDEVDLHILLKSAALTIGQPGPLTEKEINTRLEAWAQQVAPESGIDRITLRRRLVDAGYLTRSKDGASYQIAQPGPRPGLFEKDVEGIDILEDIPAAISTAREESARRKREWLEKSKGG